MDVPYREISWFINKSMKQMLKKLQLKGVLGQEMGMPGYVRSRYKTMMMGDLQNKDVILTFFNFKELETMIRSVLTKAGYKSALAVREEAYKDE